MNKNTMKKALAAICAAMMKMTTAVMTVTASAAGNMQGNPNSGPLYVDMTPMMPGYVPIWILSVK